MKKLNKELMDAVFQNNTGEIKKLLEQGVDPNFVDEKKDSPLLASIRSNNINLVKYLLENGANPNSNSSELYTLPLQEAIDTSVQTTNYNSSISEDSVDIIKILLQYGADINLKDKKGESAYDFAKGYHIPAQKLFEKIRNK